MIVNDVLVSAGMPKDEKDHEYLQHIENSEIANLFNFEKYYWVNPRVRYEIVRDHESMIESADVLTKDEKAEYLELKLKYILDHLEEEHKFLMSVKDMDFGVFMRKYQFQTSFTYINNPIRISSDDYFGLEFGGHENEEYYIRENARANFKEIGKKSNALLIVTVIIMIVTCMTIDNSKVPNNVVIATWIPLILFCIIQKVSLIRFRKKGLK